MGCVQCGGAGPGEANDRVMFLEGLIRTCAPVTWHDCVCPDTLADIVDTDLHSTYEAEVCGHLISEEVTTLGRPLPPW